MPNNTLVQIFSENTSYKKLDSGNCQLSTKIYWRFQATYQNRKIQVFVFKLFNKRMILGVHLDSEIAAIINYIVKVKKTRKRKTHCTRLQTRSSKDVNLSRGSFCMLQSIEIELRNKGKWNMFRIYNDLRGEK